MPRSGTKLNPRVKHDTSVTHGDFFKFTENHGRTYEFFTDDAHFTENVIRANCPVPCSLRYELG